MIQVKFDCLKNALSFYEEYLTMILLLREDLSNQVSINDMSLTLQSIKETVEDNRDDGQPELPKLLDEIRTNILNMNVDEVLKYKKFVFKYFTDYNDRFSEDIDLLRGELLVNIVEYTGKELEKKMYDLAYDNEIETMEYLKYAFYNFISSWELFKKAILHEFEADSINLNGDAPSSLIGPLDELMRLTTKQNIYLLNKLGFFELPQLKDLPQTKIAKIVAPLIGRNTKNVYEAIRERHGLINKQDLEAVNTVLRQLRPEQ